MSEQTEGGTDGPSPWLRNITEWIREAGPDQVARCLRYPTLHRADPTGQLVNAVAEVVDNGLVRSPVPVTCQTCGCNAATIFQTPHGPMWATAVRTYSPERVTQLGKGDRQMKVRARRSVEQRIVPLTGPKGYAGERPPLLAQCRCGRRDVVLGDVVAAHRKAPRRRLVVDPSGAVQPR